MLFLLKSKLIYKRRTCLCAMNTFNDVMCEKHLKVVKTYKKLNNVFLNKYHTIFSNLVSGI